MSFDVIQLNAIKTEPAPEITAKDVL